MRNLNPNEIQLISGGNRVGTAAVIGLTVVGGYLGSFLAYYEPLMDAMSHVSATGVASILYTPSPVVFALGVTLGATAGFLVGCAVLGYFVSDAQLEFA